MKREPVVLVLFNSLPSWKYRLMNTMFWVQIVAGILLTALGIGAATVSKGERDEFPCCRQGTGGGDNQSEIVE